jgi:hypothetical protein
VLTATITILLSPLYALTFTNSNTIPLSGTGTVSYKVDRLDPWEMTETAVTAKTSPGSYTFNAPKADVIYRFVCSDYVPIEEKTAAGIDRELRNTVKVLFKAGNVQMLRLDFSRPVLKGRVNICLFNLTGRLVTTLFAGQLFSTHLALQMSGARIRAGAYVIMVSADNKIALTKTITLQ